MSDSNQTTKHELETDNYSQVTGVVLVIGGVAIGVLIQMLMFNSSHFRSGSFPGLIMGVLMAHGYKLGKGKPYKVRTFTLITVGILGVILGHWLAYARYFYNRHLLISSYSNALSYTWDMMVREISGAVRYSQWIVIEIAVGILGIIAGVFFLSGIDSKNEFKDPKVRSRKKDVK